MAKKNQARKKREKQAAKVAAAQASSDSQLAPSLKLVEKTVGDMRIELIKRSVPGGKPTPSVPVSSTGILCEELEVGVQPIRIVDKIQKADNTEENSFPVAEETTMPDAVESEDTILLKVKVDEEIPLVETADNEETTLHVTLIPTELEKLEITSSSILKSTFAKHGNGLPLFTVPDGFKLIGAEPIDSKGSNFTQKTGMSSFSLAQDNLELVGSVDFVGDSQCFKKLFALSTHKDSASFLLHRVGKSVLVDELDLKSVISQVPHYKDWNELMELIRYCIPTKEERHKAVFGHLTQEYRVHNSSMRQFMNKCIGSDGEIELKMTESRPKIIGSIKYSEAPKIELWGSDFKFHSTHVWDFGKRRFLIGSNVPTFRLEKSEGMEDEPFVDRLTTLGIHSPILVGEEITQWNGIEMWFNSMSVGAVQTYLCHQEDFTVLKTEFINTDDIPKLVSLDCATLFTRFHKLLDSMDDFVGKQGHSYWMYRAPETDFVAIYDLTELLRKEEHDESKVCTKKNSTSTPKEPLQEAIGSLLYQMCTKHYADYHPIALRAMLAHINDIFPPKQYPMLQISLWMMYLDSRISSTMDPFSPELKLLNGTTAPRINFAYNYEPASQTNLFKLNSAEVGGKDLECHLKQYREAIKHMEPEVLNTLLEAEWIDPHFEDFGVTPPADILTYMMQPFYLDAARLRIPLSVVEPMEQNSMVSNNISIKTDATMIRLSPNGWEPVDNKDPILERIRKWTTTVNHQSSQESEVGHVTKKGGKKSSQLVEPGVAVVMLHELDFENRDYISPRLWFNQCESIFLMRDLTVGFKLITEEKNKYTRDKSTKKVRLPPEELEGLETALFDKIAFFYLILADLASEEAFGKVVMARHCAMLSIFFNKEFGHKRPALTAAARLISTDALILILEHVGPDFDQEKKTAITILNPLEFFEFTTKRCFPEFPSFRDLILGNRRPSQSTEFKKYEVLPTSEAGIRRGILEGCSNIKLDELPRSQREMVKGMVCKRYFDACYHTLTQRYNGKGLQRAVDSLKDCGDSLTKSQDLVCDIMSYLDAAKKLIPDNQPVMVVNHGWLQADVLYYQASIIVESLQGLGNSNVRQERKETCSSLLKDIYQLFVDLESFLTKDKKIAEDYKQILINFNLRKKFIVQLQLAHFFHKHSPDLAKIQRDDPNDKTKEEIYHLELAYTIMDTQGKVLVHDGDENGLIDFKKAELKEMIGRAYERLAKISGWSPANKGNKPNSFAEGLSTLMRLFPEACPPTEVTNTTPGNTSWLGITELKNLPMYLRAAAEAYNESHHMYFSIPCPTHALSTHQRFMDCLQEKPSQDPDQCQEELMTELMEILVNSSYLHVYSDKVAWEFKEGKLSEPWPRDLDVYGNEDKKVYRSYFQNMFPANISEFTKKGEPCTVYKSYILRILNIIKFAKTFYIARGYGKEIEEILVELDELLKTLQMDTIFSKIYPIVKSSKVLIGLLDKLLEVTKEAGFETQSPVTKFSMGDFNKSKAMEEENGPLDDGPLDQTVDNGQSDRTPGVTERQEEHPKLFLIETD